jgi:IclR family acetate operon transcriptional repressor
MPRGRLPKGKKAQTVRPIRSVLRTLELLKALGELGAPAGISELARMLGLSPSTVYRIAYTLQSEGFLSQDRQSGKYAIGPTFVLIADRWSGRRLLEAKARPVLRRLADELNESAGIAVGRDDSVVFTLAEEPRNFLRVHLRVGTPLPLHATAVGKVILASWSDAEVDAFLQNRPLERYTEHTVTSPERLRAELARIRATGLAVNDEEFVPGVRCLAVPVRDSSGHVVAAMTVAGPASRMTGEKLTRCQAALVQAAREVSAELGYRGGDETAAAAQEDVLAWLTAGEAE